MSDAYVDTSAILAVEFREPDWEIVVDRLDSFSRLVSSNLLEAEARSAFARDGRPFDPEMLSNIEWVYSGYRSLGDEFERVLNIGYVRGADLWHLATALHIFDEPSEVTFLTLDNRQREVAAALGFQV